LASRTTAKASGRISRSTSCSLYLRSSLSRASLTASATRFLNSTVFARNSSSESFVIEGSNSLICAMVVRMLFRKRSLLLPKTLVNTLSKLPICLLLLTDQAIAPYQSKFRLYETAELPIKHAGTDANAAAKTESLRAQIEQLA